MNKLALYVFPLGVVVGGPFLPIAIIIYWVSNNIWTFGQQHLVFGKIEKEEEAQREGELARRSANAPAPGAKPTKARRGAAGEVPETADDAAVNGDNPVAGDDSGTETPPAAPTKNAGSNGVVKPGTNGAAAPYRKPQPGARPKKRKRQR